MIPIISRFISGSKCFAAGTLVTTPSGDVAIESLKVGDDVIAFCIEVPDGSKTKNQITAIELLKTVKSTQQNWVLPGTNPELCTKPWLNHNVSNTINVKPSEWEEVEKFIYDNREFFCGISLLPVTGDKDYPQAPFTTVYTSREIVKEYGDAALWCSGLIELGLNEFNNNL